MGGSFLDVTIKGRQFYVTVGGTGPNVDVCKYCQLDAFSKLDDRQPARAMRGELGVHDGLIDPHAARYVVHPKTGAWLKANGESVPPGWEAFAKGVTGLDPLVVQPGWQSVPLKLAEQWTDAANMRVVKRLGGVPVSRSYLEAFWDEILLLLRS